MSKENVELTHRALDAFIRRDVEAAIAFWDPDGVWYPGMEADVEGGKVYRGQAEIRRYYQDLAGFSDEHDIEVCDVRDLGDKVLLLLRMTMRFASGVTLDQDGGALLTWRDGKLLEARAYMSRADALEAAGLRE